MDPWSTLGGSRHVEWIITGLQQKSPKCGHIPKAGILYIFLCGQMHDDVSPAWISRLVRHGSPTGSMPSTPGKTSAQLMQKEAAIAKFIFVG